MFPEILDQVLRALSVKTSVLVGGAAAAAIASQSIDPSPWSKSTMAEKIETRIFGKSQDNEKYISLHVPSSYARIRVYV